MSDATQSEERKVSPQELRAAYDELGRHVAAIEAGQPISEADENGQPKCAAAGMALLIGLGLANLLRK